MLDSLVRVSRRDVRNHEGVSLRMRRVPGSWYALPARPAKRSPCIDTRTNRKPKPQYSAPAEPLTGPGPTQAHSLPRRGRTPPLRGGRVWRKCGWPASQDHAHIKPQQRSGGASPCGSAKDPPAVLHWRADPGRTQQFPTLVLLAVSGTIITLFSKFFSSFPHGTCSLSVSCTYLALDESYHPLWAAIPNSLTLRWLPRDGETFRVQDGIFTLSDAAFW